jgi:hypothetical protein
MLIRVKQKPHQVQQAGSVWLGVEESLQAAIPTPVRLVLKKLLSDGTLLSPRGLISTHR